MKTNASTSVEILEDRIAPAGIVTAVYVPATGELTLTGDALANDVDVFKTGLNTYRIEGVATDINAVGTSFLDIGILTKLTIVGGDGGDNFDLTNLRTLTSLSFSGGIGGDSLNATNLTVTGKVEIHGNAGGDTANFFGASTLIGGNLVADSAAGAGDSVTLGLFALKSVVGGSVLVTGGGGLDVLLTGGDGPVTINKGISFDAAAGGGVMDLSNDELLTVGKLATGESILFVGSDATDSLNFNGVNVTLTGGIRMTGGALDDRISVQNNPGIVRIGKLLTGESILFDGGAGDDSIRMNASLVALAGGIDFVGSTGPNVIELENPSGTISIGKLASGASIRYTGGADDSTISTLAAKLTLAGGIDFAATGGANSISISGPNGKATIGKLNTGESIKYVGGAGSDSVSTQVSYLSTAGGIDFAGGDGTNSISIQGANSKAIIGRLITGESIKYVGTAGTDGVSTSVSDLTFLGAIDFAGGNGANSIIFTADNGIARVGKLATGESFTYLGGAAGDELTINESNLTLSGGIDFAGGNGSNSINLNSDNGIFRIGRLLAGQSILITGGTDSDSLSTDVAQALLAGGIEHNGAGGGNSLTFDENGIVKIGRFGTGQSVLFTGTTDASNGMFLGGIVTLAGSAELTGGSGGDIFDLDGKVTVGANAAGVSVEVTGNDGSDFIDIQDNITLAGSLKFDGGNDSDTVGFDQAESLIIRGSVELIGGADNDQFNVDSFALVIGGSLTVTAGAGADSLSIVADGTIGGDVNVNMGTSTGTEDLTFASKTNLPGGLALKGKLTIDTAAAATADNLTITNVSVAKLIDIKLGEDISTVNIDNLNAGDEFKLDTRGGADEVNFERQNLYGNSVIRKLATIQLGLGDDELAIGNPAPAVIPLFPDHTRVNFLAGLNADGGVGGTDNRNDIVAQNNGVLPAGLTGFELTTLV